ncbi:MAG: hypothetical protein P8J59_03225 [Phycisphaerales bacterium]|jgi:hypothetical protein|nr:hypothetical protein [Phycisphaerales bacterium]
MSFIQHILIGTLVSLIIFMSGCEDPGSTRIIAGVGSGVAGTGSAAQGGTAAAGLVWGDSLNRWPKDGNSQFVAGNSVIRSSFDLWLDSRQPPRMPGDEGVVVLLNDLRAYNMPLTGLNGNWGVPPDDIAIRTQAIRGIGKTLWADLRLALIEDDQNRTMEVITVMANLPRIAHGYDGSTRGLIATLATVDCFGWGLTDVTRPGEEITPTPEQCDRLRKAASWLEDSNAFDVSMDDPAHQRVMERFMAETRPRLRSQIAALCD